ncbi:MAG: NAD(P)/FAD-dependent oxidoreductase [Dehalococcoidia bacterium]|nr:NAD(P)/FAD-dependent oxidoreductase [Dehalococcoidia bacterium]
MAALKKMFSPIKIGRVELNNRIVLAPMHMWWAAKEGTYSQKMIDYYEARAKGGVGLITLGDTSVAYPSPYFPYGIGVWDDRQIPSLKELAKSVHAHGGRVIPQLVHRGPDAFCSLQGIEPIGPSPTLSKLTGHRVKELSLEEIERVIDQFGEAARRVRDAGCDGVAVHAAHSYHLLGCFLSALRNKRADAYGGSIEGRLKLLLEVLQSIRARAGNDFPIVLRISGDDLVPSGRPIEETQYIVPILVEAGVAAFHVSAGVYPELLWRVIPPNGSPRGLNASLSVAVKKVTKLPVMVVGRITDPRLAEHILNENQADMVVMGRALLADPELPRKAAEGRFEDIIPCVGCCRCTAGGVGKETTCMVNPSVGREKEMTLIPTKKPRKVLVAGGGLAGLEAARIAALRGHQVSLCEKGGKLGGQFNLASIPPYKQDLSLAIQYLSRQIEKAGVITKLNTEVTPNLIGEIKPDVVVIATGGSPCIPDLPGIDGKNVVTAHDVLGGAVAMRFKNVLVIGGGAVGCEVAEFVAEQSEMTIGGAVVSIVEMLPAIATDMPGGPRAWLLHRLREKGVRMTTSATVKEVLDDGVAIAQNGTESTIRGIDLIVLALGVKPIDELTSVLKDKVAEFHVIGDAKNPRTALEAIAEGAQVGRDV